MGSPMATPRGCLRIGRGSAWSAWTASRVRDFGTARLLLPAGHKGAAFLTFKNFKVISRYNAADAYVIGVGHLADRIMGGAPILSDWPDDERALTSGERKELQMRLKQAGFDPSGVDGGSAR